MRIALVTRRYPPECCGVGDYTSRLAETWARQGHEVIVFVASQQNQNAEIKNQEKREVPARSGEIRVQRIKLDGPKDVRAAVEAIQNQQPNAVQLEYSN